MKNKINFEAIVVTAVILIIGFIKLITVIL